MFKKEFVLILSIFLSFQLVLALPNDAQTSIDFTYPTSTSTFNQTPTDYWKTTTSQTGLTGTKTGSFIINTTGNNNNFGDSNFRSDFVFPSSDPQLLLTGSSDTNQQMFVGHDTSLDMGIIASIKQLVRWNPVAISPLSRTLIGTSMADDGVNTLQVGGTVNADYDYYIGGNPIPVSWWYNDVGYITFEAEPSFNFWYNYGDAILDYLTINQNLTVLNKITAKEIRANNICYSNGTGCNSTGSSSNLTNVAFINETNNFIKGQNVNGTMNITSYSTGKYNATLMVKQMNPYASPYTQYVALFQSNSKDLWAMRNDGKTFLTAGASIGLNSPSDSIVFNTGNVVFYSKKWSWKNNTDTFTAMNLDDSGLLSISNMINLTTITLPSCSATTSGYIGRNTTKLYFCDGSIWNALY